MARKGCGSHTNINIFNLQNSIDRAYSNIPAFSKNFLVSYVSVTEGDQTDLSDITRDITMMNTALRQRMNVQERIY